MYSRIPWELLADPMGSTEHTSGTTDLEESVFGVNIATPKRNVVVKNSWSFRTYLHPPI